MKCIDCEHYDQIKLCCELNIMCIGKSEFKKIPSKKVEPKEVDIAERLVQAKRAQDAEEEVLRRLQMLKFAPIEASEIQSPQIVRMSLQSYENLTNRACNQGLEIKNLKSAIEDMNSKLLKKNKEINELQAVIKTLGGLL